MCRRFRSTRRCCCEAMTRKRYLRGGRFDVLHLAALTDFLPVRVLSLQLVLEMDLFRRNQAQGGVIDSEAADVGGQAHTGPGVVWFVVSDDLLDVYRRRKCIDVNVGRINHAYRIRIYEPDTAIRCFRGRRPGTVGYRNQPNSIRTIECRRLDRMLRVGDPGLYLVSSYAHEPAARV